MTNLHKYPFIRLLLPLMAGIFLGDFLFFRGCTLSMMYVVAGLGVTGLAMCGSFFLRRYSLRWLFGVFFTLFGVWGGVVWMNLQLHQTQVGFSEEEQVYRAFITEKPQEKERSILCKVQLANASANATTSTVLLYLAKDSLSFLLKSGDELLLSTRISPPKNNGNPDEFDYVRYARRQGIGGTGYVASGHWQRVAQHPPATFLSKALANREHILDEYRRLGFEGETFAVLSALTVGYMSELDKDLFESYSISGASHVLSLSGLHIGFLYALLLLLLRAIPGGNKPMARAVRASVIILALWAFAFFTGLSPSVVRSVCMFSLFALSGLLRRESFTYNTLFATAFFMLLFSPAWLFDVGFQLSFVAVLAILWLHPRLYQSVHIRTRIGKYIWGMMSISIAAQIGTAPLVLFYFSRFSTHFLLTNLFVIPLASAILYAAVILLLCTPFPLFQVWVAVCVRWLVDTLNAFVRWVEHLPGSSVDDVWVYPLEIAGFYLLLWMGIRFVQRPLAGRLITCMSVTLVLCICHDILRAYDRPRQSVLFYHVRECPAVHCIASDGDSWLVYADSLPDEKRLQRAASRYWNRLELSAPQKIYGDDYRTTKLGEPFSNTIQMCDQIISFGGKRICVLNDNRWRNKTTSQPLSIDYLYLCKGYTGRLEWVTGLFDIGQVILDSSLPVYRRKALEEECYRQGIGFVSLSEQGSVRFML